MKVLNQREMRGHYLAMDNRYHFIMDEVQNLT